MAQENVSIAENAMADIREPLMQVTLSSVLSVIEMTRLNLRNHIDLLKTPRFFYHLIEAERRRIRRFPQEGHSSIIDIPLVNML